MLKNRLCLLIVGLFVMLCFTVSAQLTAEQAVEQMHAQAEAVFLMPLKTLSDTSTYGANNEPPPGDTSTQSWKWAVSTAGEWALDVPSAYKPITIKVLDKP